jgi:hypothetical protein
MFAQRPRPLTPALSPKGRGSNAGQFAVARFEVTHFGSLSPGGGRGLGEGSLKNHPISPEASEIHIRLPAVPMVVSNAYPRSQT